MIVDVVVVTIVVVVVLIVDVVVVVDVVVDVVVVDASLLPSPVSSLLFAGSLSSRVSSSGASTAGKKPFNRLLAFVPANSTRKSPSSFDSHRQKK